MHMDDVAPAGPFRKIVDVLGDMNEPLAKSLSKLAENGVGGIGNDVAKLHAAVVAERMYDLRPISKHSRPHDLLCFDTMIETAFAPIGPDSTVRA